MPKRIVQVLTAKQAVEILKEHGFKTSVPHIYAGIDCGAYDFGVRIDIDKQPRYEIYTAFLIRWIKEREIEENGEIDNGEIRCDNITGRESADTADDRG